MSKLGLNPDAPDSWPTALSGTEFRKRFPVETEVVEFKEGLSRGRIEDSIVAYLNSDGGFILIGVRDDGTVKGFACTPKARDTIDEVLVGTKSPGTLHVRPLRIDGREITVVGVPPLHGEFAQTGRGRVMVRRGTRRLHLAGRDLVEFIQQRAVSSFEDVALDVAIKEASDELIEGIARILGAGDLSSPESFLVERGLAVRQADETNLTVAGALYLLDRPDDHLGKAYIEVLRFPAGSSREDRRVEVVGPLNRQVAEATKLIYDELGADEVVLGLKRHSLPRLPERVIREAISNAVAHRSYEQRGTPVRVELRPEAVEVSSPGGLVDPVTLDRMREQHAARNNRVIKVLRAFGLAEDQGKGVDIMLDTMRDELLAEPTFEADETSVTVRFPVVSGTSSEERAWVREVETRGSIEARDRVLLVHARRGEELTNRRARELLNASRDVAHASLTRLTEAGLMERIGRRGGTRYRLAADLAPPAGLRLTRTEMGQVIVELVAERGPISNSDVRGALGLDRQEALVLLDELVRGGRLIRFGERRGTKYRLPG